MGHPLGKSPVITVEAPALSKPMVVAESAAICEYLCDHFAPHLVPKRYKEGKEGQVGGETEEWLRYRFYMHYAEGSLMTLLLLTLFMDNLRDGPQVPWFIKPVTKLTAYMDRLEGHEGYKESIKKIEEISGEPFKAM